MGANGSYDSIIGGVTEKNRSHIDTGMRVGGHKVLLQKNSFRQSSNVLWSNSDSPIYLSAKKNPDGTISILNFNIFEGHKIKLEVNLKFNPQGKLLGYNEKKPDAGSHAHEWHLNSNGKMVRKPSSSGGNLHLQIPASYLKLINEIVKFNKAKHKHNGRN